VQIGKEGWDCRSLTGVILSQKKDSPTNMVLQTSCRCLRQVTAADVDATALVWLSGENARILNKQLSEEQKASIASLNAAAEERALDIVKRHDRTPLLSPPEIDYVALYVRLTDETVAPAKPSDALGLLAAANCFARPLKNPEELRLWQPNVPPKGFGLSQQLAASPRSSTTGCFEFIVTDCQFRIWIRCESIRRCLVEFLML
jgi:hypothetical protein